MRWSVPRKGGSDGLELTVATPDLEERDFREICDLIYRLSGIHLREGKEPLVKSRLMKRLRALGMRSYREYLSYVGRKEGEAELASMIDALTTNKTSFFREAQHFQFLAETVFPGLKQARLRFWSAACSSGEEPYTLAMVVREAMSDVDRRDVRILATDISRRMLDRAKEGVYPGEVLKDVPPAWKKKYFSPVSGRGMQGAFQVRDSIRAMTHFARLNLIGEWPMKGPFQVIFCRNAMIYFDRNTQQTLVDRFYRILDDGGYLLVGHAEGLSAIEHRFRYVRPAVYQK